MPYQLGRVVLSGQLRKTRLQPRRVFGHFALVLLTQGQGFFIAAGHSRAAVRAGDILVLFPDLWHSYGPEPGESWQEHFLVFDGPVFDLWRQTGRLDPSRPIIRTGDPDTWDRRFGGARLKAGTADPAAGLIEVCRLQQILADLYAGYVVPGARGPGRDLRSRVTALLDTNPAPALRTAEIARRLGDSSESFRKRFKRGTGEALGAFLRRRMMAEASRQIIGTDDTCRAIAERLGFCDEYYFSRAFKQATGYSPLQYRRTFAT